MTKLAYILHQHQSIPLLCTSISQFTADSKISNTYSNIGFYMLLKYLNKCITTKPKYSECNKANQIATAQVYFEQVKINYFEVSLNWTLNAQ